MPEEPTTYTPHVVYANSPSLGPTPTPHYVYGNSPSSGPTPIPQDVMIPVIDESDPSDLASFHAHQRKHSLGMIHIDDGIRSQKQRQRSSISLMRSHSLAQHRESFTSTNISPTADVVSMNAQTLIEMIKPLNTILHENPINEKNVSPSHKKQTSPSHEKRQLTVHLSATDKRTSFTNGSPRQLMAATVTPSHGHQPRTRNSFSIPTLPIHTIDPSIDHPIIIQPYPSTNTNTNTNTTTTTPMATTPTSKTPSASIIKFKRAVRRVKNLVQTLPQLTGRRFHTIDRNRYPITITFKNLSYTVPLPETHVTRWSSMKKTIRSRSVAPLMTTTTPRPHGNNERDHMMIPPTIPTSKVGTKILLNGINGYCKPGTLLAIMGPSGAGKTCLLNILSDRIHQGVTGQILYNGHAMTPFIRAHMAYVPQADLFIKTLTVKEHLMFQAILRIKEKLSPEERERRVDDTIAELGLSHVAHRRIGAVGQGGISGGERRRLSFANEILTNPSLLLVDEPTSGLDAFMAEEVISKLRHLTTTGRTVICTIHAPSSDVYALFDDVMYVAQGRVAYFGKLPSAIPYFSSLGRQCPEYTNPSDYIIKQLSIVPSMQTESRAIVHNLLNRWDASKQQQDMMTIMTQTIESQEKEETFMIPSREERTSWFTQFTALCHRSLLDTFRDPLLVQSRLINTLFISILLGLIYSRLPNDQKSVQNKTGAIFFILINQSLSGVFGVLQTFPMELPIFLREYHAGMYRVDTYYLARTLSETPMQMSFPLLFITIAYWTIGFNDDFVRFIGVVGILLLQTNCAISLGYLISALFRSIANTLAVGPGLMLPFVLLGGFFINSESVPVYLKWFQALSFFKYGNEAINIILWRDSRIGCSEGETCTRYVTGDDVLASLSMHANNLSSDIGIMIALLVAFRIIACFLLLRRAREKR